MAPRRLMAAGVGLLAVLALVSGATPTAAARSPLRVLQLNLCNSGIAGCYTGRSVAASMAVLRSTKPDVVTLNEVCEADVTRLATAMTGGPVAVAFMPAPDRPSGDVTRCRNGQAYGIGLLVRLPTLARGYTTQSGVYADQDFNDPEIRVWLCIHAVGAFYACTTHLASTSVPIAIAQCRYLLGTIIPDLRARAPGPAVVGGDLNLRDGDPPQLSSCVPVGYLRTGDGNVQHILATTDLQVTDVRQIGMRGTTDHPGLLAALTWVDAHPTRILTRSVR